VTVKLVTHTLEIIRDEKEFIYNKEEKKGAMSIHFCLKIFVYYNTLVVNIP